MAKPPHSTAPDDKIQRVPRGLLELLSLAGGQTPYLLSGTVAPSLELLQLYGLTQLQSGVASNAVSTETVGADLVLSPTAWTVLFAATGQINKTATMTALFGTIVVRRTGGASSLVAGVPLGPFGATETGFVSFGGYLPYPLVCPPGTVVTCVASIIGTDATAVAIALAEFGVLG